MCFKLDNGSELFSVQDMHRLRRKADGAMGSRSWARGVCATPLKEISGDAGGKCSSEAEETGAVENKS